MQNDGHPRTAATIGFASVVMMARVPITRLGAGVNQLVADAFILWLAGSADQASAIAPG